MDKLTAKRRSQNMASIRSINTTPELFVRRMVHGMGYRYALHSRYLPGKPDLVFRCRRKVIFVHGCFWHQHPKPSCRDSRMPKSRLDYWLPKLRRTIERDLEHQEALKKAGWKSLIVWECELGDRSRLIRRLSRYLEN